MAESVSVALRFVNEKAKEYLPKYMSAGASGMDLTACLEAPVSLQPGERKLIPTGIAISLPEGYEAQIRPRSGLAIKNGITLVNTPGTIDSDYRGEISLIVINLGNQVFEITHGMRVAQMVIAPYVRADFKVVQVLDETTRGAGGFGHTGVQHSAVPAPLG